MRTFLLVLAIAVPFRPEREPPPLDSRPFVEQLKGEWEVTVSLNGGQPHTSILPGKSAFVFTEQKMTLHLNKGGGIDYPIFLDLTKSPIAIDINSRAGQKGNNALAGIVKIEGDTLTFCYRLPSGADRPTEFTSPAGSQVILWQMKRVKK